ncbi:MAG: ATP-binding protein [bacterium]
MKEYIRKTLFEVLSSRLKGGPRLLQVVIGPRQVGKTTLVLQLYDRWTGPKLYKSADLPNMPTVDWIIANWEDCRALCKKNKGEALLVMDEIQKIPRWSEVVKKLFDEDKRLKTRMRVVLLGSSSLLMQKGLTESLAGRFEIHRHNHWSFPECKECFNLKFEEYLYFGGYPGAIPLRKDEIRWARYIRDSLIETVLSKDVILMSSITKPALLRQVFGLCIEHPAEIMSYQKMMGQLQDAGNTTTIAFYLKLLANAFLIVPLERYSGNKIRQRGSIPKIVVLDNALISAISGKGFKLTVKDKIFWGRMVENAVGSKLYSMTQEAGGQLFYWRERNDEVDYVIQIGQRLIAIEVKSGASSGTPALHIFAMRYKKAEKIVILESEIKGTEKNIKYITLEDFFSNPYKSIGIL